MSKKCISIDLHDIKSSGVLIDKTVKDAILTGSKNKLTEVVIITGKGSGQLKKRVVKLLQAKDLRGCYKRIKNHVDNQGRISVFF